MNGVLLTKPTDRPDSEVPAEPKRRLFTAEYKSRLLDALDAAIKPGEKAAILRREGLYSSTITDWRRARSEGSLGGAKMGRPLKDPRDLELEKLARENQKLRDHLRKASLVIDVQKKSHSCSS
jgi:transposase-like protein